jgi:hypothetical protein
VDFGFIKRVDFQNLFKFPLECAELPFQAVHFTVTDMPRFGSETSKANSIMLKNFYLAMAFVE